MSTAQAYLVNTGPGPDSLGGAWGLRAGSTEGLAAEFTLTQPATITEIEGWMAVYTSGDLLVTIRADGGEVPGAGDPLHSQTFTAPQSPIFLGGGQVQSPPWPEIWSGPTGLNWTLEPGTYWVGFETIGGSAYDAFWPNPSGTPLGNEAFSTNISSGYNFAYDDLNIGVRIKGSAVPLPGAVWLFGSGLLGLGALGWRRRRKD